MVYAERAKFIFLCSLFALIIVIISLAVGSIIANPRTLKLLGKIWPGINITKSEATGYFIQAFLAVVIGFATIK